jgi:hypothetical protein
MKRKQKKKPKSASPIGHANWRFRKQGAFVIKKKIKNKRASRKRLDDDIG